MFFKNRDIYYFIVRLYTFFVDNRQYGLPKMAALFLNLLYKAGLSGALHLPESPDKPVSPSRQLYWSSRAGHFYLRIFILQWTHSIVGCMRPFKIVIMNELRDFLFNNVFIHGRSVT